MPHILPEAMLQIPLVVRAESKTTMAPFARLPGGDAAARFVANPNRVAEVATHQPPEIVERHYADPQRAILAIQRGEVDVLARVFPGDIPALRSNESLVVAPYAGPTTHALAVRSQNPFLNQRTFRRALVYGANRDLLLSQGILRGKPLAGFRVVSGLFPAPTGSGDLPTYAYDASIEPHPYDPRLAMTLRLVAEGELKASYEKQEREPPKLAPLVLGHPADETSRVACRGLVKGWKQIGVECKLIEFAPGVFDDRSGKCDLVYLQLVTWEPLVDAARLLGPEGLAPAANPFIQLALRQIEAARNWQEGRQRLVHLHRLLHEDVTLLPLWQTMDHFAYRRSLFGITPRRLNLYQDVEQWRAAGGELARKGP
jgi:ABC-type transport system substrate-binding protein